MDTNAVVDGSRVTSPVIGTVALFSKDMSAKI